MADIKGGKRACLIYVQPTAGLRQSAKAKLEANGYSVCEVKASLDDALAAKAGHPNLPAAIKDCIAQSELCVFLLPEIKGEDGLLDGAAALAHDQGKRIIGVVAGSRIAYPENFDDHAESMVRENSQRIDAAICGTEVWERPDRSDVADRQIRHVRCQ